MLQCQSGMSAWTRPIHLQIPLAHFEPGSELRGSRQRVGTKIQQTKMLATCQRFGVSFLFGLVWKYSSVQTNFNKSRLKVMDTYLCLVVLHVPKRFGLVQMFCARPKIYLHFVAVTNILCQTKRWFAFSKIGFCAGTKVFECLVLLQVPKCFVPVQIFWASPKI